MDKIAQGTVKVHGTHPQICYVYPTNVFIHSVKNLLHAKTKLSPITDLIQLHSRKMKTSTGGQ